jgi:phage shock protein PspC (stress-responsive transcriptional regulator)
VRRIYRSTSDSKVFGVCGGLGDYLGIDPTLIRIFFVILTFIKGIGMFLYLFLAVIVPRAPHGEEKVIEIIPFNENPQARNIVGGALVTLGLFLLLDSMNMLGFRWLKLTNLWSFLLIFGGFFILWRIFRRRE